MSKGHESEKKEKVEKTGEVKKPGAEQKKGGEEHHAKKPEAPAAKGKHSPLPGACNAVGCKAQATRFNFCNEHYDHFKFGLIKKSGEPVSDYEKKIEHFLAMKAKEKG